MKDRRGPPIDAVALGVIVFLVCFALHMQLIPGDRLAPVASQVRNWVAVVLWLVVIWGGWPLVLAIGATSLLLGQRTTLQATSAICAVIVIAAAVAAALMSSHVGLGIVSGLAFYLPYFGIIGGSVGLLILLIHRLRLRAQRSVD